jgi:hypothetical protein
MLMTNPVVDVNGDSATATLLWTGILNTKVDAPPQFVEQGREYDRLVKKDGQWRIAKRVVIADSGLPDSFKDTYSPRKDYDIAKDESVCRSSTICTTFSLLVRARSATRGASSAASTGASRP